MEDNKNWDIEKDRCTNGYDGMTGEEYFFYNYFKIDGKLPAPGTWDKSLYENRKLDILKSRRPGTPPFNYLTKMTKEEISDILENCCKIKNPWVSYPNINLLNRE